MAVGTIERMAVAIQRWWWWHAHGALWGITASAQRGGLYRQPDGYVTGTAPLMLTGTFVRGHLRGRHWPKGGHTPTPYAQEKWPTIFRNDG